MGRIWTRPRTQVAAQLLRPRQLPYGPLLPKDRSLVSALILSRQNKIIDVNRNISWSISGTPAFTRVNAVAGYSGNEFVMSCDSTDHLYSTSQRLRDLPLRDAFTLCWYALSVTNSEGNGAVLGWSGSDDVVFYHASSSANAGLRSYWRDVASTFISSDRSAAYRPVVEHVVCKVIGTTLHVWGYQDGVEVDSQTHSLSGVTRGPFTQVEFGAWESQYMNLGGISSFMAFDRAFSAVDVAAHSRDWYGYALKPAFDRAFVYSAGAPPAGNIARQHYHHRHHNMAG